MTATVKDVVINLAMNGVSAATAAIGQLKKSIEGIDIGKGSPLQSVLAMSFGPEVAQASSTASDIMSLTQKMMGRRETKPKKAASKPDDEFNLADLVRGEDGIWRMPTPKPANSDGGGAFAALSKLATPMTALAAVVIATTAAMRQLSLHTKKLEEEQKTQDTKFRTQQEQGANDAVGRHLDQSLTMSRELPDVRSMEQGQSNQRRRSDTETDIRRKQEESGSNYGMRQTIRSRSEEFLSLTERDDAEKNRSKHLVDRKAALTETQSKLDADRSASKEAFERTNKARSKEFKVEKPENKGLRGLLGHAFTGRDTSAMINANNERVKLDQVTANAARAGQETKEAEMQARLNRENLSISQEMAQSAAERLNILRQQTQTARRNADIDKEMMDSGKRSLGSLSPGERTVMKSLEEKIKRIQGGSAETLHEGDMERGSMFPVGTYEHDFMQEQLKNRGEGIGTWKKELLESQNVANVAEKKQQESEPELMKELEAAEKEGAQLGKDLVESIKKAFGSAEFFAQLQTTLKTQQEIYEKNIALMLSWIR